MNSAWRSGIWLSAYFIAAFSTLVIDGFPAGAAALREFGSRPTNFLLAFALLFLCTRHFISGAPLMLARREMLLGVVVLLGIPAINLPVALLLQPDTSTASLIADWSKQYAMLLWGLVSYAIWKRTLRGIHPIKLAGLVCLGALVPVVGFYGDLAGSSVIQDMLGILRVREFSRASGMATEPALYASWLAFVWPFVLFYSTHARAVLNRVVAFTLFIAICLSGYLSHARTIAVIVILQLAYYAAWTARRSSGLHRFRALVLVSLFGIATVAAFAASLSSLGNSELGSNISRIGSTVTAVRVSIAYPVLGVGIGQLKYFFGAYAPDFALASEEILTYAVGLSEYRASTFNLFVRFFCEFGFVAGVAFSILVLKPIVSAVRLRHPPDFVAYATLAAIGGVGYWLTQDQYGYQPGIASLAILANFLSYRAPSAARSLRPAMSGT